MSGLTFTLNVDCRAVKFHPEGVWLLSAALDLHIRVWNLQNSECLACLEGHFSAITDILIDPLHTDVVIR